MGDGDIVLTLNLDDKDFAVTVKNSGRLLRELRSDLNKAATGTTNVSRHFGSFSTSLRHTVMSLAAVRFAVLDFYDIFLRLPSAVLQTSGEIERLTKLMGGLSSATTDAGRKNDALRNTEYILDLAKKAPFEVRALADSFVKLKAGGIDPTNGSMQALIDSVARFGGTSETLHRASVAIQQMAGKGVISMEELRQQLGEAVPTAMRMMAEGIGVSLAELTKQVALGAVASGDALRRMFTVMEFYNKGAAAEMMTTWTGMTSRMKTEWVILQTAIGEAGFADAVKDQLRDLIKAMGSQEGIAMAKSFGQNLASLVRTLREVADWLRENWQGIIRLGQVIGAVFIAKKILEFGSAMRRSLRDTAAAINATATKYRNEATLKAQTVAANARADATAAADKLALDSAELARSKAHYTRLTAQHAAHLAEIRKLNAANAVSRARVGAGGVAEIAVIKGRQEKIKALRQEDREIKKLIASEKSFQAAQVGGLFALSQQTLAKEKMAKAAEAAASKVNLVTKAGVGMRMAIGALGGPIGIVTTALMLGIPAWLEWGNTGEKAIRKIRDALSAGTATEDTINLINQQLINKRRELYELENERKGFSLLPTNPEDVQQSNALKAQLEKDIADLESDLGKAKSQKLKNEATARFRADRDEFEQQEAEARRRFNSQAGEINARAERELLLLKKGSKEAIDLDKQKNLALQRNMIEAGEALHKIALAQQAKASESLNRANKSGNSGDIQVAKDYLDEVNAKLLQASKFRDETAHLLNAPQFKEDKVRKPDSLTQALEQSRADLDAAKIKMDDLLDGAVTFARLRAAAAAEIEGDRKAGRFSKKDERGNFVAPSADNSALAEIAQNKAMKDQIARETTAQKELNRLKAISSAELNTSVARFDNDFHEKESTGVHRLQRSLAALQQTLVEGSPAMEDFKNHAAQIISDQAIADLNNFAAGFKEVNADLKVALEDTEIGAKQAAFDNQMAKLRSQLEFRKQAIINNTKLTNEEVARLTKLADEELKRHQELAQRKHLKDMRSPMEELSVKWDDVTARMREASTRWANDSIDALVNFTKTGKLEWGQLVETILTDLLRIRMQQTIGVGINAAIDKGVNFMSGLFGASVPGATGGLPIDATTGAVKTVDVSGAGMAGELAKAVEGQKQALTTTEERLNSVWSSVQSGFSNVWNRMGTMLSSLGTGLMGILNSMGSGLNSLMSSISGSGGSGFLSQLAGAAISSIGSYFGGMGGGGATASYTGYGGMGSPTMRFADGGIMTELGAVPLRKYARGGIANFPQFAEFGEGSMPEAYVPLPDGRTIPVTLKGGFGGGGSKVTVNVINNASGTKAETREGRDQNGNMSIDVIIEQIEGKISSNVSKGRGSLSTTMEKTYGLSRAPGAY